MQPVYTNAKQLLKCHCKVYLACTAPRVLIAQYVGRLKKKKSKEKKEKKLCKFLCTKTKRNSIKAEMMGRLVFLELTGAQL